METKQIEIEKLPHVAVMNEFGITASDLTGEMLNSFKTIRMTAGRKNLSDADVDKLKRRSSQLAGMIVIAFGSENPEAVEAAEKAKAEAEAVNEAEEAAKQAEAKRVADEEAAKQAEAKRVADEEAARKKEAQERNQKQWEALIIKESTSGKHIKAEKLVEMGFIQAGQTPPKKIVLVDIALKYDSFTDTYTIGEKSSGGWLFPLAIAGAALGLIGAALFGGKKK